MRVRHVLPVLCCLLAGCSIPRPSGPWGAWWTSEEPVRSLVSDEAAELDPPEGLRATSGEYRVVPLKWDPLLTGQVAGYIIESSAEVEGPFERIAIVEGRGHLAYVDGASENGPELGDGATRYYRVRAFDTKSRASKQASEVVVGTTAGLPDPPWAISAYSRQPREVPLSWQSVAGHAVGGYRVERSPAPEGPYETVAKLVGRHSTSYLDTGLGDLRVFYYRVRTTNLSGTAGEPSLPVRAVTKPVPLPPMGLRVVEQKLGSNVLGWESNVEEDVVEYRIFRLRDDGTSKLVATASSALLEATDPDVGAGQEQSYVARALDRDGLESTDSLPITIEGEGYDLHATRTASGVELRWDPREDEGFVDALIERTGGLGGGRVYRSHDGRLLDEDGVAGRRYEYVVRLERLDGSQAPASQPVSMRWPDGAE